MNELPEEYKAIYQKYIDESVEHDEGFRQQHETMVGQISETREAMMAKIRGRASPIPNEVQQISNTLVQHPALIPGVIKYIQTKIVEIEEATRNILGT
jgi:hypothetical protein